MRLQVYKDKTDRFFWPAMRYRNMGYKSVSIKLWYFGLSFIWNEEGYAD